MLKEILKTIRINHYIKNLIVFVPLVFSMNINKPEACLQALIMFVSFCLISSVIYIFNDLTDIKSDRQHPIKCSRPLASGKIKPLTAVWLLIFFLCVGMILAGSLNSLCVLAVVSYIALNILYTLKLKHLALIDVLCIAIGFILRILSGCFAISVIPSPLVILLTFFLSMFFTFSKRTLEAGMLDSVNCRPSIKDFDVNLLKQFIIISAVLTISFYFNYMLDPMTIEKTGSKFLYITTIPFTIIIFRLIYLIFTSKNIDDPVHFIYKDNIVKSFIIIYLIVLFITLKF